MKKSIKPFFLIIFLLNFLFADKFVIESFKRNPTDLAAYRNEIRDRNNEICAIIKIKTDLDNLKFESNQLFTTKRVENDICLFVSPGIRNLQIIKDGFIPKSYNIPIRIETQKVYILELTNKEKTILKIISKPRQSVNSKIYIDGLKQNEVSPAILKIKPGFYSISLKHPKFVESLKDITLYEGQTQTLVFNMRRIKDTKLYKQKSWKRKKLFCFATSIALAGFGYYATIESDNYHEKYNNSTNTDDTKQFKEQTKNYEDYSKISYGASVSFSLLGIYSWIKQNKYKR